ncbi:hypothetical protein SDC9_170527 [bioreactor metagenome]|uniref:Uncharacterized protein n=1 Tax=bioreactor metagenome TaxID=1076179 RepID=A0A645GAS7_9ZZZZ
MARKAADDTKATASKLLFSSNFDVGDEKCCIYQVYRISEEIIRQNPYERFVLPKDQEDYEVKLLQAKRTGMLGSAFLNETRLIYNQKNLKKDRAYVAVKAKDINGSGSYIFLLVTNVQSAGTKDDIVKYENAIKKMFDSDEKKATT